MNTFVLRLLVLAVIAVGGLLVHESWAEPPTPSASSVPAVLARLRAGEPVTIVCIGDSITGVYYHTGGRRAYPEMVEVALKRALPGANVKVINAGISGDTLPGGLKRFERDVLSHKPNLVTIMFGMNDLTRWPAPEFQRNLVDMIQRSRNANAEVLLCTQNSVIEPGRDAKKLALFSEAIREVGRENKAPVADCHKNYEDVRAKNQLEWRLLLSDEIHPNMDGHKVFAEAIAGAILGTQVSLAKEGPPQPGIPKTLALLKAGKPIRILAMPPYDKLIGPALRTVAPTAEVKVTTWPTAGQSLREIEQAARKVRGMNMDLVVVAVPASAGVATTEEFHRSFSWVLNWSLSFGYQQWDCIAIPPSTEQPRLATKEAGRDRLMRRLIAAQDLSSVNRAAGDAAPAEELLIRWLRGQLSTATAK